MDLVPESPEVSVVLNSLVAAIGTLSTAAQKITAVARPLSEMFRRAAPRGRPVFRFRNPSPQNGKCDQSDGGRVEGRRQIASSGVDQCCAHQRRSSCKE